MKNSLHFLFLCCILFNLLPFGHWAQAQMFVSPSGSNSNGQSWGTAFNDLQTAIDTACANGYNEIWVAQGVYLPTKVPPTQQRKSFYVKNCPVKIYGGFNGTETSLSQRDFSLNVTTLSGDLGVPGDPADDAHHVVVLEGVGTGFELDGFTVTGGKAQFTGMGGTAEGGGLYNTPCLSCGPALTSSPTIANCIFTENKAVQGGAIYSRAINNATANLTITNCSFTNNSVTHFAGGSQGGALYITCDAAGSTANLTMSGSTFDGNFTQMISSSNGGAVYARVGSGNMTVGVTNCTFTNNMSGGGGAVYHYGGHSANLFNVTYTNCAFTGNTANNAGGAMGNRTEIAVLNNLITLQDCVFENNTANNPGGNSVGGAIEQANCNSTMTDCTFTGNVSTGNGSGRGGAIHNEMHNSAVHHLTNCVFTSNMATGSNSFGGALMNNSFTATGTPTYNLNGCVFKGNTVGSRGGAVCTDGISGGLIGLNMVNCVLTGNQSNSNGGAVFNRRVNASLINCSIAGNKANLPGGALYFEFVTGASTTLKNCILWGNSSEIFNSGTPATATYSIVQGGYPGTANLDQDPLFVEQPNFANAPTTTGDLHLSLCSPAVDSADAALAPATDLDGNPRPVNNGYDMGAFELQDPPGTFVTCFADTDGDGYGDALSAVQFCNVCGPGYLNNNLDCNDADPDIYPGAIELCGNGIDDDCDGLTDEADPLAPSVTNTWTGAGDGVNLTDPANWSLGIVPIPCHDVVIPPGSNVMVPSGSSAEGKTLDVKVPSQFTVPLNAELLITNE